MATRLLQHILFWLVFLILYALANMLFAGPSDMAYPPIQRFFRFLFTELAFLPWKAIPFYFLFYFLIPRYFFKGQYFQLILFFLLAVMLCVLGYRSMIAPVSQVLYNEIPDFAVYSPERLLFTLTDILPPIGLAGAVKLLKGRLTTQRKVQELQREKQAAELNFLKAQANPHFLFNTLNNLYGLARKDAAQTAPSIMKLANIMRYILHECSKSRIPLSMEVQVMENYIELEKLRYGGRLKLNFQQEVDNWEQLVAPLILLPFVENAFKHGAGESRFEITIDIKLRLNNNQLSFSITNPREDEQTDLNMGTGLQNVSRQLELIYGNRHKLDIRMEKEYFSVYLEVALEA